MINEDKKNEFLSIEKTPKATNVLRKMFAVASDEEDKTGVDLCEFSEESAIRVIQEISGGYISNVEGGMSSYRKYIKWFKENGFSINEDILKIKVREFDLAEQMRENLVGSPLDLLNYLDKALPQGDFSDICLSRCLYWFAFMGVDRKAFPKTKIEDVHFTDGYVICKGEKYPLYRQSIKDFKDACELDSFSFWGTYDYPYKKKRVESEFVMRTIKSKSCDYSTLQVHTSKEIKNNGVKMLSYSDVQKSGMFYRKFEDEVAGLYDYFEGLSQSKRRHNVFDYNTWKRAFNKSV